MSLRIGWASPWNMHSAIAQSGVSVVTELARRGHAVDILRTEVGEYLDLEPRPAPGPIRRLHDTDPGTVRREHDAIVVNLGNHYGLHGALLNTLPHLGAVVILHDRFYADLVQGAFTARDSWPTLRRMVRLTYGDNAISDDQPFYLPTEDMLATRSMLEWFAGLAVGAVVHAKHYATAVRDVCPGPVITIPLAYPDPGFRPPAPMGNDVTIVTIGHVNRNKCCDRVIMAMARFEELRQRCRYRLLGPYEESERQRLLALAHQFGVAPPELMGWIPENDLLREVEMADIISCLRNPVLEGGSASVIFGMLSGRPLLVSDHGIYGEIPDDLVFKCRPGEEVIDVAENLLKILRDPGAAQARGLLACDYARKQHSPCTYVDGLVPFLEQAISVGPAISASIALGRTLASFGLKPDDPATARAVEPLASLF
jgi:glycosyltransferase involved in cell wall biosynthesis